MTNATNIAPWISVGDGTRAIEFYAAAFGALELERMDDGSGGVGVAHLSVDGAEFWISQDGEQDPHSFGDRSPVHMILTVDDPDSVFARALEAGAIEVNPVRDAYGWRIGRLADPLGHHWEVGKPL